MTVRELIGMAEKTLQAAGVTDAETDARLLYCHLAGVDRTKMILQYRDEVPEDMTEACRRLLSRRAAGEPLQYIVGRQDFMGLPFHVAPGVLIPRPETELLVEKALEEGRRRQESRQKTGGHQITDALEPHVLKILDVGCGSGAIGISVAKLLPGAQVTCTDISREALEIAGDNAVRLGVNVEFLQGDLLEPVKGRQFDMILSNPPYISRKDMQELAREVREHEPEKALCGGEDGLEIYRRLCGQLGEGLCAGGLAMMEIGYDQMEAVKELLGAAGAFTKIAGYKDLAGRDRIVTGERIAEDEASL